MCCFNCTCHDACQAKKNLFFSVCILFDPNISLIVSIPNTYLDPVCNPHVLQVETLKTVGRKLTAVCSFDSEWETRTMLYYSSIE